MQKCLLILDHFIHNKGRLLKNKTTYFFKRFWYFLTSQNQKIYEHWHKPKDEVTSGFQELVHGQEQIRRITPIFHMPPMCFVLV